LTFSLAYDIISSVGEIRQLLKGAERPEVAHQKKQPYFFYPQTDPADGISIRDPTGPKNSEKIFQKGVDKRRPFCYNIIRSGEAKEDWDPRRTCLSFLKVKESQTYRAAGPATL